LPTITTSQSLVSSKAIAIFRLTNVITAAYFYAIVNRIRTSRATLFSAKQ